MTHVVYITLAKLGKHLCLVRIRDKIYSRSGNDAWFGMVWKWDVKSSFLGDSRAFTTLQSNPGLHPSGTFRLPEERHLSNPVHQSMTPNVVFSTSRHVAKGCDKTLISVELCMKTGSRK